MSYLVLARKYRPQSFAEVIGQEQVTSTLQNAILRGRIHHAFLFCGGRGTGKTTTARILAKALCCENAPTPNPCNQCNACVEITQGTSVDVQEIDAASQNKVEDVRELRESIRYAPLRGKKKVFILDEVHMLSTSAFNALLKTLEEPPPHAVFIFATTDPHKIPATILSRVQRYDFKLVTSSLLIEHLAQILTKEQILFEPQALFLIAQEGGGSVRDCLSLLDQVLASHPKLLSQGLVANVLGIADRSLLFQLGAAVVNKDAPQALELVRLAYERGYDLVALAKTFLGYIRDLLIVHTVPNPASLLAATADEIDQLKQQAATLGDTIELLFHRTVRMVEETTKSPFPRFILEVGLVELCHTEPLVAIDVMVQRLEALEAKALSLGGKTKGPSGDKGGSFISNPKTKLNQMVEEPKYASEEPAKFQSEEPKKVALAKNLPETPVSSAVQNSSFAVETPQKAQPISTQNSFSPKEEFLSFEVLIKNLMDRAPLLHSLALCHPLLWDGASLILGVKSPFLAEQLRGKLNSLHQSLKELLHKEIAVEIRMIPAESFPGAQESILELEQKKSIEEKQQKERNALSHPSRNLIHEVFGEGIIFQEPIVE